MKELLINAINRGKNWTLTVLFSICDVCANFCCLLDTMDNWDEKKLEEVVNKKHGEAEKKKPKTQIVCLLFSFFTEL